MRHETEWGVEYLPTKAWLRDRKNLDRILKHSKFDSKTKALWAYYRDNKSVKMFSHRAPGDKMMKLYLLNLHANGALETQLDRMITDHTEIREQLLSKNVRTLAYKLLRSSIRPVTRAHWDYAIRLIDIAKGGEK